MNMESAWQHADRGHCEQEVVRGPDSSQCACRSCVLQARPWATADGVPSTIDTWGRMSLSTNYPPQAPAMFSYRQAQNVAMESMGRQGNASRAVEEGQDMSTST